MTSNFDSNTIFSEEEYAQHLNELSSKVRWTDSRLNALADRPSPFRCTTKAQRLDAELFAALIYREDLRQKLKPPKRRLFGREAVEIRKRKQAAIANLPEAMHMVDRAAWRLEGYLNACESRQARTSMPLKTFYQRVCARSKMGIL